MKKAENNTQLPKVISMDEWLIDRNERFGNEKEPQLPKIVSRDEWLVARKVLLAKENEGDSAADELNNDRSQLPMVQIDKDYVFDGPEGKVRLLDLFDGRGQLIVGHFMFDPDWDNGCPGCSAGAEEISDSHLKYLHANDTSFVYISRAPQAKIEAYKERKGWTFPWYSSYGSDFNYDYHVTLDESVAPIEYNYRTKSEYEQAGNPIINEGDQSIELPGRSWFLRVGGRVYHTYSGYGG